METALFIGLLLLTLSVVATGFYIIKELRGGRTDQSLLEWLKTTAEGQRAVGDRLDRAAQIVGSLQKELGTVTEASRGAKELLEMLRSPKLRGGLAEQSLEAILASFLPRDLYQMQYRFSSGEIVDSVIKLPWGLIPIDAKFPKENFERHLRAETKEEQESALRAFRSDVKKHIDDIAKKYLRPEEGVKEDLLMYIPFEAVYGVVDNDEELVNYARKKRVDIVSPNVFVAFLRHVLRWTQEQRITENLSKVIDELKSLDQENQRFGRNFDVLSRHLTNAKGALETTSAQYQSLSARISQVAKIEPGEKSRTLPEPAPVDQSKQSA